MWRITVGRPPSEPPRRASSGRFGEMARPGLEPGTPRFSGEWRQTRPTMRDLADGPVFAGASRCCQWQGASSRLPRYRQIPEDAGGFGPTGRVCRPKRHLLVTAAATVIRAITARWAGPLRLMRLWRSLRAGSRRTSGIAVDGPGAWSSQTADGCTRAARVRRVPA